MRRLLITSITLATAAAAQAQISWLNPVDGNWNDATKWAGGNVPDNAGEVADIAVAGTYGINFNFSATIGGMTLTNPSATVSVVPNNTMALGGATWTNNGLVVVNSTATNAGTVLRSDVGALTLGGSGTLRLNANPGNLDTAQMPTNNGGFVVTNSPSHKVKGVGRVRIAFANQGLVEADVPTGVLELAQFDKSNSGTMRAAGGGVLQISSINVNNAGGQIIADGAGSIASYVNAGISGGGVTALNGGLGSISNSTFSDLIVTGSHQVNANTVLALAGAGITNNGTITVNPTAANAGTALRTDVGAGTIDGTGTLRLNANPGNLDTAQLNTFNGSYVLTHGENHTISGIGRIRIAMVNDGLIRADAPGDMLELAQFNKTNNNIMEAVGGAVIQFSSINVANGAAGEIRADGAGSIASYVSCGISGGALSATDGALGSISNSTFSDLTVTGPHQVVANTTLAIAGAGITNNGTLTINPTGTNAGTFLRTDVAAGTIDGTGTVQLNAAPFNLDTAQLNTNNGGYVLTLGPNQTVRGTGAIRINTVNNGLIDANDSGQALALRAFDKTNNATMRATNGGTLSVESIAITNNGQIRADGAGSVVGYSNSAITGGQLIAAGGGLSSISNSTFSDLTVTGPHQVVANTALAIAGAGITNNGTITINPTGTNAGTFLRTDVAAGTIDGTGTVQLNAAPTNLDTAQLSTNNGGFVLTLGPNQTVRGTGAIRINTVNNGLIDANDSGQALALRAFDKTNNAMMRATNGGTLSVESIAITNNGQIRADGAGSVVGYSGSAITGGQLIASGGGLGSVSNCTFSDLTVTGPHQVNASTYLAVAGAGITNNGTITVNPTGANSATNLRVNVANAAIDGTGTVHLNALPSNLDTGLINTNNAGFALTLGPGQSLTGTGAIRVRTTHEGRMSPGSDAAPIGRIEQRSSTFAMNATSSYAVDIGGVAAGGFDTFGAVSSVTVDGDVIVNLINGFVPVRGDEFAVVTANPRLGEFDHLVAPPIDDETVWRIRYTGTQAILSVTCPGDINGDHVIELPDLATLLTHFGTPSGAEGFQGDADGDGDVDLTDLALVLIGYGAPCP